MSAKGDSGPGTDQTDANPIDDQADSKPFFSNYQLPSSSKTWMGGEPIVTSEEFLSDNYKMNYPNRGRALIINNRSFDRRLGLGERTGTDQDATALHQRFSEMGFEVLPFQNLNVKEMLQCLSKAAGDDDYNMQADCFVCAILTHGEEGVVYGTDGKVEVKQLVEPFKGANCKGLVGKPKIFFIQVRQIGELFASAFIHR